MKRLKLHHLGYWLALLFVGLLIGVNLPEPDTQTLPSGNLPDVSAQEKVKIVKPSENKDLFLVTKIIDGDTIELQDSRRVRYLGMDTPESVDPKKPVQCLAEAAAAKNKELVLGQKVTLKFDQEQKDRYGRTLAYVFINSEFINLELVELGLARAYPYAPNFLHKKDFAAAQERAQQKKLGLWSGLCDNFQPTKIHLGPPDENCALKGNISTRGEKIYHLPSQKYYNVTRVDTDAGEKWFCSEKEAQNAGWRKSGL